MCYIAILYFACQCRAMYHVYCDKGDPPPFLCEGDDRHLVAKYIYGGRCEQCKDRAWVEEGEERECHLQDQLEDLRVECLPKDQEKKYHENIVKKHNIQERFAEDKLENESDDIDFTVEWVKEHLNAAWTGNEKALKRLGYMQACDMKVRLNKELKKPEGLQKKSKPRNTPIPTGWQKFVLDNAPGPSTRSVTPGPELPSSHGEVSVPDNEAAPREPDFENELDDAEYSGKGKGKEVAARDRQKPSIN